MHLSGVKPVGKRRGRKPKNVLSFSISDGGMITEINDNIIGKTVWYFHPKNGVSHITVTGIYHVKGRRGVPKWGLWYDAENRNGNIISMMLWVKDYHLFETRLRCEKFIKAMLKKSEADREMDAALGLE
jgi:hypothetical protein